MTQYEDGFHVLGVGDYTGISFDDVIGRIFIATGTSAQFQLANWLGIRQSWVSDAKRRNGIPVSWLKQIVLRTNFNPYWIMTGQDEPEFKLFVLDCSAPHAKAKKNHSTDNTDK